jgi:hypothetical protein
VRPIVTHDPRIYGNIPKRHKQQSSRHVFAPATATNLICVAAQAQQVIKIQ